MTTQPTQKVTNADILVKLDKLEKDLKEVQKTANSIIYTIGGVVIGSLIGWFWPW